MSKNKKLKDIAQGFGFMVLWNNNGFGSRDPEALERIAKDGKVFGKKNPNNESFLIKEVTFEKHTVQTAVQLACNDSSVKAAKHNGEKIESKLVHTSEQGVRTIEFLGYEKVLEKQGKRRQIDRVVIDDQGQCLDSGSTDVATSWISAFQKHLNNWNSNDMYSQVIKKYLSSMKALNITKSNYYVMNTPENLVLLDRLRVFMNQVGCELLTLTQAEDKNTQAALTMQVKDAVNARLDTVKVKLDKWKADNRVHGRSENAVMSELTDILTYASELQANLKTSMTDLIESVQAAQNEANAIINSQAPAGVVPAIYTYFQSLMVEDNVFDTGENGSSYMFNIDLSNSDLIENNTLSKEATKALKSLDYYGFMANNVVMIRPIAEIGSVSI